MMRPMSPLPRMTQRRVGSSPSRFVKCCAVPAVNTPAGRVPWMKTCFAVRSRQPVASTSVRVSQRATPSRLTVTTAKPAGVFSTRVTKVCVCASMPSSSSRSMKRSTYSGPASRSPKRARPKPS